MKDKELERIDSLCGQNSVVGLQLKHCHGSLFCVDKFLQSSRQQLLVTSTCACMYVHAQALHFLCNCLHNYRLWVSQLWFNTRLHTSIAYSFCMCQTATKKMHMQFQTILWHTHKALPWKCTNNKATKGSKTLVYTCCAIYWVCNILTGP